ncbi:MAG: exopolysaccharide biosynthesis polyprenyl glycosylphosphotransferase [Candidatus Velthaea sp.]
MTPVEDAVPAAIVRSRADQDIAALRQPREYSAAWVAVLLCADIVVFLYSSYLGTYAIDGTWDSRHFAARLYSSAIFVALWIIIFQRLGLYRRSFALSVRDEIYFVVVALGLGTLPQMLLFTIAPELSTSRSYILASLLFAIALVSASRAVLHVLAAARRSRAVRPRILFASRDALSLAPAAFADMGDVLAVPVADYEPATLLALLKRKRAGAVVVDDMLEPAHVQRLRAALAHEKVPLLIAPPHLAAWDFDYKARRVGERVVLETLPLAVCTPTADLTKRLMDVAIASVAIVLTAPVMLAAAAAIVLSDGAPVFFRQVRVGKNGLPFEILKFRTMRRDAEAAYAGAVHADPRITRVGAFLRRTSIDELPQFFNVLHGEMSVVGPRPEMASFAERYARTIPRYREIQQVRPGITSWGSVYMSRVIDESDLPTVVAHDLFYLQHWSPQLDLTIVLKTAVEVLFHRHD